MNSLRFSGSRKAFTLVELLVVVAIIALLISILLPSLAKAREQAYQVKCASNLKSIWLGIFYYAEDKANGNGHLVQLSNQWASGGRKIYPGAFWAYQILPYVTVKRSLAGSRGGLLRCPANEMPVFRYINAPANQAFLIGEFTPPGQNAIALKMGYDSAAATGTPSPHLEPISYTGSCDARSTDTWYRTLNSGFRVPIREVPAKLANLTKPYCYPILTEGFQSRRSGRSCFRWSYIINTSTSDGSFRRHYGGSSLITNGVNWSFADGHVQWHSAVFASNQLVCCISYDPRVMNSSQLAALENHCKRK